MEENLNGLSPAQTERLAILAEECGEVVQIVGKILRHGYASYHPRDNERKTNRTLLETELGDLRHVIERMTNAGDVSLVKILNCMDRKAWTIHKYLHHQ